MAESITAVGSRPVKRQSAVRLPLLVFGAAIVGLVVWRSVAVGLAEGYPLSFWVSQALNGLVLGGVYALVALGYTLVYGILLMINFAHGEVMMVGGFIGYFTLQFVTARGWIAGPPPVVILALLFILVAGMTGSILTGAALERIAYRPLRRAPRLVPLISAIGASLFLQYSVLLIFGVTPHSYRKPALIDGGFRVGPVFVSLTGVIILGTSIVMMLALYLIIQRTKLGKAMRAVAEDKDTAALMGVDVDQVIVFTFVLGSALAGAAGVMLGFHNTVIKFNSGFVPGLKAFTAAVLGGIGNIPGAMFGALILGLIEAIGPSALGIPAEYKDIIAFTVLVLILIFRPTGLFGEVLSEKKA
ncbi:MAG: branched-chain amino acid ABC transporter permease [Ardenticatenaceae bacterium]|nr:branched-chain amino acid ABC transporter permease [Ardenticatenaceae bacterium]HBY99140.1 branched-chain amino acid ABC transporter permease [Chloroflexota bacterium]